MNRLNLEAKMETMKKELSEEKDSTMDIQQFYIADTQVQKSYGSF